MYRVLLVEDDEVIRYVYSKMKAWGKYGFRIEAEASNGAHALERLKEADIDVVFTDIRMPIMDGIALMKQAVTVYSELIFVFISSYNEFEYAREGLRLGAVDYIVKPMTEENLEDVLPRVAELLVKQNKNGMNELFARILPEKINLEDGFLKNIGKYLEEHMQENLTLEDIAEEMGLNKDYLGKQVKSKTGMTFRSFYNQIKMEYAKPLIKSGQYKVYEISELLGYASPDYFTQLFKNIVKMTPAEYKKSSKI